MSVSLRARSPSIVNLDAPINCFDVVDLLAAANLAHSSIKPSIDIAYQVTEIEAYRERNSSASGSTLSLGLSHRHGMSHRSIGLRSRPSPLQTRRSFRASVGSALSHSHQSSPGLLLLQAVSGKRSRLMCSDVYSSQRIRYRTYRPHTRALTRGGMKHAEWGGHTKLHRSQR